MNTNTKQLTLPGFPEALQKELYTLPKSRPNGRAYGSNPKYKTFEPLLPMFSISPDYIAIYNRRASDIVWHPGETKEDRQERKQEYKQKLKDDLIAVKTIKRKIDTGTLSRSGRARFKQRCGYLFYHSDQKTIHNVEKKYTYQVRLNLITLTITQEQMHDDRFIKRRMYKNFIDALRKQYPGISYVWRAEPQENGNLHIHILTDHYVPVWYANGLWLTILKKKGYKHVVKKKADKEENRVWVKLNPVDTEKVRNEKDLGRYMRKYLMKGLNDAKLPELKKRLISLYKKQHFVKTPTDQHELRCEMAKTKKAISVLERRKITGKIWGCSDNLSLKPYRGVLEFLTERDQLEILNLKEIFSDKYTKVLSIDDFKTFLLGFSQELSDKLLEYYNAVFPKIACPYNVFYSNKNYSYSKAA